MLELFWGVPRGKVLVAPSLECDPDHFVFIACPSPLFVSEERDSLVIAVTVQGS